jgi:SAM-dependent methyltransferase
MFKKSIRTLKEELYRFRHRGILNSMTEMEQFRIYISRVQPQEFLLYQKNSPQTRLEFQSVVSELGLNLRGSRVLDIGPGYGDSLDICYEKGAKGIEFVEIDPFFFTYNRLKRFAIGYQINHMIGLSRLEPGKFDLVWIKGAVSADLFIARNKFGTKIISIFHWLTQLVLCQA